jgi:hypothetical protein
MQEDYELERNEEVDSEWLATKQDVMTETGKFWNYILIEKNSS